MAHSNGVITAPVGIDADIAPVLGVGSYDLGYLCSNAHGKINKFSRYKPVVRNVLGELPQSTFPTGIRIVEVNLSSKDALANSANTWLYSPPTGGDSAPYRALDFNGYNHNAPAAFWTQEMPDEVSYNTEYSFDKSGVATGGTYNLGLNDLLGTTEVFAGIIVRAATGAYKWYSTRAVANRPLLLDFKLGSFWNQKDFERDIDIQLFLCNYYQSGWASSFPSGMKVWLPDNVRSKHYDTIKGTKPSLPSSTMTVSSYTPVKVKWSSSSSDTKVVLTVTTINGEIPTSSLRLKVKSYLGYISSLDYALVSNPTGTSQFKWISNGDGTFSTTDLNIRNTLILNSSGNPIVGSTPRTATIEFYDKVVLSTITYYTTLKGRNPASITLSNA